MRAPRPMAAALLCAAQLLAAAPGMARVEMPPGQAGANAESGGRAIHGAGRHHRPGCAPAYFLPMFELGWWMPFLPGGCLGLQQIEMQTRLDAGVRAGATTPPPSRAPRLVVPLRVKRGEVNHRHDERHERQGDKPDRH